MPTLPVLPVTSSCDVMRPGRLSQITTLIIIPNGSQQPADGTDIGDFDGTVGSGTGAAQGRFLNVVGALPYSIENRGTLGRTKSILTHRRFTATLEVRSLCDAKFALVQALQSNWTGFRFWLITAGSRLIGGSSGLSPEFVGAGVNYLAGRNDREVGRIVLEWISLQDANRGDTGEGDGGGGGEIGDGGITPPAPPPPPPPTGLQIFSQFYNNNTTGTLVWTANGGNLPADRNTQLHVYQQGKKLNPLKGEYTITGSTVNVAVHFNRADYQIFAFV